MDKCNAILSSFLKRLLENINAETRLLNNTQLMLNEDYFLIVC